jgi:rhodanese-related sulfurtransferase
MNHCAAPRESSGFVDQSDIESGGENVIGGGSADFRLDEAGEETKDQNEIDQYSIAAEELHSLMASGQKVLLFDVRQPLDLLAYPEIIPGAQRIPPKEALERASVIPKEKTRSFTACSIDKTSQQSSVARGTSVLPDQVLKGGLAAWKGVAIRWSHTEKFPPLGFQADSDFGRHC